MINLAVTTTIVTVYSIRTAAGEEIGWRGYMLTRLIDAGVPKPVLLSGVIWGLWHVPLILGGVYLAGPPPVVSAALWLVTATAFASFSRGCDWRQVAYGRRSLCTQLGTALFRLRSIRLVPAPERHCGWVSREFWLRSS